MFSEQKKAFLFPPVIISEGRDGHIAGQKLNPGLIRLRGKMGNIRNDRRGIQPFFTLGKIKGRIRQGPAVKPVPVIDGRRGEHIIFFFPVLLSPFQTYGNRPGAVLTKPAGKLSFQARLSFLPFQAPFAIPFREGKGTVPSGPYFLSLQSQDMAVLIYSEYNITFHSHPLLYSPPK